LDAIDARDLDVAVGQAAHTLLIAGCPKSLDVRRALALGEIARHELTLDLTTGEIGSSSDTGSGAGAGAGSYGKDVTLYVHLDAQDPDLLDDTCGLDQPVALIEKTGAARDYTLRIDHLREWLTRPGTTVVIRPVIDLNATIGSKCYHPSPRLREQVILRNQTCIFPHCAGPTTEPRPTTRGTYTQLSPGEYLWHSPHGPTFHVDPTGTTPIGESDPPPDTPHP